MERESKNNINKARWNFFTKVVQCLLDAGGVVFGGAVRDIYARDYNSKMYYETVGNNNDANKFYLDEEYHKEFKDRMIFPKDLDASIHRTKQETFLQSLHKHNFHVKTLFTRDAKTYLPNINVELDEVMHLRLEIRPHMFVKLDKPSCMTDLLRNEFDAILTKMNQLKKDMGIVIIDLLVNQSDKELDPPFGDLDFECNGLILTKDGIRLSRCLHDRWHNRTYPIELDNKLARIKQDILRKYAVPILDTFTKKMEYRTSKMIQKGYTIHMQDIITINHNVVSKPEEQHYCILCHEEFDKKHYKLSCCEARYHEKCLILIAFKGDTALNRTHSCIMCRQRVPEPTRIELNLLRCIFVTTADKKDIPKGIELIEEENRPYLFNRRQANGGLHPHSPSQENIHQPIQVILDEDSDSFINEIRRMSDVD